MRNQGSWPDTAVKPGFTGPAESQTRVQTADHNRKQGSEGANTAKTGSGDPQTRDEGSQVSKRGKQGFPGLAKRQTRVPRGRKEANKGSQRSKRGKQGFTGSGAAQTRVFSAKKPQNRVPSTAKY